MNLDLDFNQPLPRALRQQLLLFGLAGLLVLGATSALVFSGLHRAQEAHARELRAMQAQTENTRRATAAAQARIPKAYEAIAEARIVPTLPLEPALHQLELLANSANAGAHVRHVEFQLGRPPVVELALASEDLIAPTMLALCVEPSIGRWELVRVGPADSFSSNASAGATLPAGMVGRSSNGLTALPPQIPPQTPSINVPLVLPAKPSISAGAGSPGGGANGWRAQLEWHPEASCATAAHAG